MELLKEIVDYGIMIILGLMGFIALMYSIERVMFLSKVKHHIHKYSNQDEFDNALTNNLTTLYIIYSNAPYVGLLGTVVGIMITFYDMGKAASIDSSQIMTGLSLALYATALGLVVAIPTLIAYNALNRKIAVISSLYPHVMKQHQTMTVKEGHVASSEHIESSQRQHNPSDRESKLNGTPKQALQA